MSIISKESLEILRQRIDLVDVLAPHIELKKMGASYKALCPFHDEKNPSFVVQRGDSHYHCFGCGAHGDAISFLMTHLKMNFIDAIENLAQKFNVPLERIEGGKESKGPNKALLKEALDSACRFYHFCLLHTEEGSNARRYLYGRGIDLSFIKQFKLGLAPKIPSALRKIVEGKSIRDEILAEAGLLVAGKDGGWRDFFYDRITFPIQDSSGAVIGFSARKYREDTFGGKYVNTPETPLFKKSRVLFGLNYCRRRIPKERQAIIVEGQIDALRLIQAGFNITVAGQGTAFGEGHAKELIALGVSLVYLALDGDQAGQEAALKIGNLFQKEGIEVRHVQLPEGADPDFFIRKYGAEAFHRLMEDSVDYLTFLVGYESKRLNMDSPAGKNELVQSISDRIRGWNQDLMVHESLRKLAFLTQTPENMILLGQSHTPNLYIKKSGSAGLLEIDPDKILETDFLRWMLRLGEREPRFIEMARMNIEVDTLQVPLCRLFYQTYMERYDRGMPCDLLSLASQMEEEGQALIDELMHKKINMDRAQEQFLDSIHKILVRNWMQLREAITNKIKSGQCSDDEVMELAKQFDVLKNNPPKTKASRLSNHFE
jgi:DNA primase